MKKTSSSNKTVIVIESSSEEAPLSKELIGLKPSSPALVEVVNFVGKTGTQSTNNTNSGSPIIQKPKQTSLNFDFLKVSKVTKQSVVQAEKQRTEEKESLALNVEETVTQVLGQTFSRVINYSVQGSKDRRFRTADSNLIEKIESFNKGQAEQRKEATQVLAKQTIDSSGQQQASNEPELVMRYFTTQAQKKQFGKCRLCKQDGHYQRHCTESVRMICHFCMANHTHYNCDKQNPCFKCNGHGHMAKDCRVSATRCTNCNKLGHKESKCGVLLLGVKFSYQNHSDSDIQRLKCLKCGQNGHVNCHKSSIGSKGKDDGLYGNGKRSSKYQSRQNEIDRLIDQRYGEEMEENTQILLSASKRRHKQKTKQINIEEDDYEEREDRKYKRSWRQSMQDDIAQLYRDLGTRNAGHDDRRYAGRQKQANQRWNEQQRDREYNRNSKQNGGRRYWQQIQRGNNYKRRHN